MMKIKLDTSNFEVYLKDNLDYRDKYLNCVETIKKDWKRIEDAIITRASSLLPFKEYTTEFTVSITILDEDTTSDGSIAIDPILTTQTEAFVSKVAHNVHSLLCYELLKYDIDAVAKEDMGILRAMEEISIEGIGDHIDAGYFVYGENHEFSNEKHATEFKAIVRNISKTFENFNSILRKISQDASQKEKLGEELREFVPPYGNPLGYYMTNIIIKNSFLDEMLSNIGNPFNFFKLYNKAVLKDRVAMPSLSKEAIDLINKLEKKYLK